MTKLTIASESARLEVIAGDIRDPFFVRGAVTDCDTVFHLAALIAIPFSYIAPQSYVGTSHCKKARQVLPVFFG